MSKTKVYVNGSHMGDITVDGSKRLTKKITKFQIFKYRAGRFMDNFAKAVFVVSIAVGSFQLGGIMNPTTVAGKEIQVETNVINAPVLDRIAKCESSGSQDAKNGQITYHSNSDGSIDVGKYQINIKYYGAVATKLGLDLTKEDDNRKMAEWIYLNRGTSDWSASANCWNK